MALLLAIYFFLLAVFSFNLGDGTAVLTTDEPVELGAWHVVEIRRRGRRGEMQVNSSPVGEAEAPGEMERLSISSDIYVGGVPGRAPFPDVADAVNFTGCVEDLYLGLDPADFDRSVANVNVKEGCKQEVR